MVMMMMDLYRVWFVSYSTSVPNPILVILVILLLLISLLLFVLVPGSSFLLLELALVPPVSFLPALLLIVLPFSVSLFRQNSIVTLKLMLTPTINGSALSPRARLSVPPLPTMIMIM